MSDTIIVAFLALVQTSIFSISLVLFGRYQLEVWEGMREEMIKAALVDEKDLEGMKGKMKGLRYYLDAVVSRLERMDKDG